MYEKMQRMFDVNEIVSVIIIHALDLLLLLVLLPFMVWEWISARHRVRAILRAIIEITLELTMWIIFAGVSILITVFFVFDDVHCSKTYHVQEKCSHVRLPDNDDKSFHVIKPYKKEGYN